MTCQINALIVWNLKKGFLNHRSHIAFKECQIKHCQRHFKHLETMIPNTITKCIVLNESALENFSMTVGPMLFIDFRHQCRLQNMYIEHNTTEGIWHRKVFGEWDTGNTLQEMNTNPGQLRIHILIRLFNNVAEVPFSYTFPPNRKRLWMSKKTMKKYEQWRYLSCIVIHLFLRIWI